MAPQGGQPCGESTGHRRRTRPADTPRSRLPGARRAHTRSASVDPCAPDVSRRLRKSVPKAATPINRPGRATVTSTPLASAAPSGRTAAGSPVRVGLQPRARPALTATEAAYGPIPTSPRHASRARQPLKRQPPGRTHPEPGPFGNHHRGSHALNQPEGDQLPGVHSRSAGERDGGEDREPGKVGAAGSGQAAGSGAGDQAASLSVTGCRSA